MGLQLFLAESAGSVNYQIDGWHVLLRSVPELEHLLSSKGNPLHVLSISGLSCPYRRLGCARAPAHYAIDFSFLKKNGISHSHGHTKTSLLVPTNYGLS